MNEKIKHLINKKKAIFRKQKESNTVDHAILSNSTLELSNAITFSKAKYHEKLATKLNDPKTAPKTYWSILKTFVNGSKIPLIPPLLVNNEFVIDFLEKANLFNDFFREQCRPITNDSSLPNKPTIETVTRLSDINIDTDTIIKLIRSLDPNKAHGCDGISIRMLKLCATSISKPLHILFNNSVISKCFPNEWKKANIISVHKKGDKQIINNYRPVSLLPICSKIFEKIIFNSLFEYLEDNKLLNCNQSGFRSGDSCVHQLLSITHEIYKTFDANPSLEVRGVFLDISKAFDRVWHVGLLYKLKLLEICGSYYNLVQSFLDSRHQRVVLNGKSSKWSLGSILGPLLFLVYINDLPQGLRCNVNLFVDDTSLFSTITSPAISSSNLNENLVKITHWAYQWKMSFNPDKTKQGQEVIFSQKKNNTSHPSLYFNNTPIQRKSVQKHLGLFLDEKLSFLEHIDERIKKATVGVNLMRKLNLLLPRSSLLTVYKCFIRPHLEYGDVIYDQPNLSSLTNKIESVQYNADLAITGAIRGTSKEKLYQELGFESLKDRRWLRRLCYLYKIVNTKQPAYLYDLIPPFQRSSRNKGCIYEPFC